ncbi:family 43 glycosylhydrolase [Microbacterium sp. NPDC056234]|uniref:family 43 glycosylhydrolase n=1 Tax=Microbacterium sp. NPDC056234 TaxID=3345757 RepID=UPI0035DA42E1
MSTIVQNPVLRGFMPDASIALVNGSFLVAHSSFEWVPMIPLHRSTNLVDWEYAGSIPTAFVDLLGVPNSCGVWAPSLSYDGDSVWIVFSVLLTNDGGEKDIRTWVSRSADEGRTWDLPTRVPSTGFDPALFHEDGRTWLLNMRWDSRPQKPSFGGITVQELDRSSLLPLSEPTTVLDTGKLIEGPGLQRRDGWLWLSVAEGGTGWEHGITTFRSKDILGPYEQDPRGSFLTTRTAPEHWAQKAGHGEILTLPDGEFVLHHLGSRVLRRGYERYGIPGREMFLENIVLDEEGWPRLLSGTTLPARDFNLPKALPASVPIAEDDGLRGETPGWPWSTLRQPADRKWADLLVRPGWLRLRGRDSLHSHYTQSMVARRIREFPTTLTVRLDAAPSAATQYGGLVVWYDTTTYVALLLTADDSGSPRLVVRSRDDGGMPADLDLIALMDAPRLQLRARIDEVAVRFDWRSDNDPWRQIGTPVDVTRFSDDYRGRLRFTGPMVGMTAVDTVAASWTADFGEIEFID